MKSSFSARVLLIAMMVLLSGCVTEHKRGLFKDPTKEDLQQAIDLYVQIVYMAIAEKDYEQAMKSARSALDIDKHSAKALNALANTYVAQGDTDKAEDNFTAAISSDSKFTRARVDYGKFLYNQKKYKKAVEQLKKASEDDFYEDRAAVYYNLGACLKAYGKMPEAVNAFSRAAGIDPAFAEPHLELAQSHFEQKQFPEAKKHFDAYMKLTRDKQGVPTASALWLGIRIVRFYQDQDAEASYAVFLKNAYPYSQEYLDYKNSLHR